jgi:hypothetical protein
MLPTWPKAEFTECVFTAIADDQPIRHADTARFIGAQLPGSSKKRLDFNCGSLLFMPVPPRSRITDDRKCICAAALRFDFGHERFSYLRRASIVDHDVCTCPGERQCGCSPNTSRCAHHERSFVLECSHCFLSCQSANG